jgi:UDP-glucuronate 4-epimerase
MSTILVTGAAGFIGFHTAQALLARGETIIGLDNLNDYYDVNLKRDRLSQLTSDPNFQFYKIDLADREAIARLFAEHQFDAVIHLAAQAGVRYSIQNPHAYVDSNLVGFVNILEGCRQQKTQRKIGSKFQHLVYASSSSVYGANRTMPFSTDDNVDHPISLYAATKKANELMAHTYSHLYQVPTTGLRFFTVYGPWGRPDMAAFLFTQAILENRAIDVYNYGKMQRDFTYIDDIVEGIIRVLDRPPTGLDHGTTKLNPNQLDPNPSTAPYRVYNIGNHQPVELGYFIEVLEQCLGIPAKKNLLPLQPGDVLATYADISDLTRDVGFQPRTPIDVGLAQFVDWYKDYYGHRMFSACAAG